MLETDIPYRLGHLDYFFHALKILTSDPPVSSVFLQFDTGHEIRGRMSVVTNAWVETGIITCRVIADFLEGKVHPKYPDDVTIMHFEGSDGTNLKSLSRGCIVEAGPSEFSREFIARSIEFALNAADKAVAHLTLADISDPEDVLLYQAACRTLKSAIHIHLYDALGEPRPQSPMRIVSAPEPRI
ncbi:MAG: hypothetical protein WCH98_01610 [Verrucomicrobiota bacterium]